MNRRLVLFGSFGVVLVVGLAAVLWFGGHEVHAPAADMNAGPHGITLSVEKAGSAEARTVHLPFTPAMTALDALAASGIVYTTKDYGELGKLVQSIQGVENNTDGKDWFYYVNGTSPSVGAGSYQLHDGDQETWKFEVPK